MTFTNDKNEDEIMNFILATSKAMKRYMGRLSKILIIEFKNKMVS